MSIMEWGQVAFIALVAIIGIGGMIKVLFFDKNEKKKD